jgi:hypothetical protein
MGSALLLLLLRLIPAVHLFHPSSPAKPSSQPPSLHQTTTPRRPIFPPRSPHPSAPSPYPLLVDPPRSALAKFYAGGWRGVPPAERWWEHALSGLDGELQERLRPLGEAGLKGGLGEVVELR